MPFFRAGTKLVYYAHVPKCGGTAVADYIQERFGPLGLHDAYYLRRDPAHRWSRTSPQHVDTQALWRLVPMQMFDACFAVVRHPVARAISTYHFQLEVERSVPPDMGFGDWLRLLEERSAELYAFDNHIRPMTALVPIGATVFHLEHGLDTLVPWFDALAGDVGGPRALSPLNQRGEHVKVEKPKVRPTDVDLERLGRIYASDFERYGYRIGDRQPAAPPPALSREFVEERERFLRATYSTTARLRRKLRRKVVQWIG